MPLLLANKFLQFGYFHTHFPGFYKLPVFVVQCHKWGVPGLEEGWEEILGIAPHPDIRKFVELIMMVKVPDIGEVAVAGPDKEDLLQAVDVFGNLFRLVLAMPAFGTEINNRRVFVCREFLLRKPGTVCLEYPELGQCRVLFVWRAVVDGRLRRSKENKCAEQ